MGHIGYIGPYPAYAVPVPLPGSNGLYGLVYLWGAGALITVWGPDEEDGDRSCLSTGAP